jgi:hypothetical protein
MYFDNADHPKAIDADLLVAHFWAFERTARENSFGRSVAVYVLSNPVRARALLGEETLRHEVPFPSWVKGAMTAPAR